MRYAPPPRVPPRPPLIPRRAPCAAPRIAPDPSPTVYAPRATRLRRTAPPFPAPSPTHFARGMHRSSNFTSRGKIWFRTCYIVKIAK